MKRVMLMSVAAIALAAGSTVAMAQGKGKEGGAGINAGGAANAPMNAPAGAAGGASGHIDESPAPGAPAAKRAQERIPEKQKSTQQAPAKGHEAPQQQGQAAPHQQPAPTKQSQGEREKSGTTRQSQSPATGGTKQGTAQSSGSRAMTTSNVSLTTEQKTVIRSKVLTGSAPRVTNVHFDIKIGTVVPRTVRVAPVPVTLIEIEPKWRGYMYFVYADEIIIVEPRTLEIVAVLAV
jgi:hypothetical protein